MKAHRATLLAGTAAAAAGAGLLLGHQLAGGGLADTGLTSTAMATALLISGGALRLVLRTGPAAAWSVRGLAGALALLAMGRASAGTLSPSPGIHAFFFTPENLSGGFLGHDPLSVSGVTFLFAALGLALLTAPHRLRAPRTLAATLATGLGVTGLGYLARVLLGGDAGEAAWWAAALRAGLWIVVAGGIFAAAIAAAPAEAGAPPPFTRAEIQLSLAFGTILGCITLGSLTAVAALNRAGADQQRDEHDHRLLMALRSVATGLELAEVAGRQHLASGHGLMLYRYALDELDRPQRELLRLAAGSSQLPALARMIRTELARLEQTAEWQRSGHRAEVETLLADTRGRDQITVRLTAWETNVRQELESRAALRADTRRRAQLIFAASMLGVALVLVGVHVVFQRDLVARHQAEAALRRHNDTLKSFAHTVAHDLRAPLRGIAGYARELELQPAAAGLPERGRFCITQIRSGAQHLEHLIEDTLDFTRLDSETPQYTFIDLPVLITSLLRQREPQLREQHTEVSTRFGTTTVISWERGLAQVIGNLLDNAIKYSRHAQPPRLRVETAETPVTWQLIVSDNGIGFDMKHHDRIFGLFQRLVTPAEFEGTGAGLAIVRKITDRLGGTVKAQASPGGGAAFLVELPKLRPPELA